MLGTKRRLPRINADRSWLGNTPCGLFVFKGFVGSVGSGQKMLDWAGGTVLQKLLGLVRLAVKPELAIGARVIFMGVTLGLPAAKAWTTPCFPRSGASQGPPGMSSAKIWVTKTVSSASLASPLFVIARAVGLRPTSTAPTIFREAVSTMKPAPAVWLGT